MYLTQGLHRSVQQNPDKVAAVEDGHTQWTFAEFVDRVARLGAGLHKLGAQSGDRIGILSENSVRYIEYALACPWAGFVFAPINSRWSLTEQQFQMEHAGIDILLVDDDTVETGRKLVASGPQARLLLHCGKKPTPAGTYGYESLLAATEPMEDVRMDPSDLAGILYTGGTTGLSKGVMLSAGQLQVSAMGTLATNGMSNCPEKFLHVAPFYHLAALGAVYQQVLLGSTHFVLPKFTPEGAAAMIAQGITSTTLVPTMIQRLFDYADQHDIDLSSLRVLGYGGSPISETVLSKIIAKLPDIQLSQRYGMTELGPVATVLRPEDHRDPDHPERLKSAGRAALHSEIRILDPEGKERPKGEVGEIVVRGSHVMIGYWRDPYTTAETLRNGWMHTGDMGYLDEAGYLFVVDRLKDMIVTGGENVYSAEVERVLSLHPDVESCAVIGVPDPEWGERVHAVIVEHQPGTITSSELREFCSEHIARYKAPRSFEFVEDLPRTPIGKVLKRQLRENQARQDSKLR